MSGYEGWQYFLTVDATVGGRRGVGGIGVWGKGVAISPIPTKLETLHYNNLNN
jgi:hypothetical protein